jgi:hypothetical protein
MRKEKAPVINHQYSFSIPMDLYKSVKSKMLKEDKKLRPLLIEMLEKYVKK